MCGITGWVDWQDDLTNKQPILENMVQTLTPRGPDDKGTWTAQHVALGHRRLIVIDPVGGVQPMIRSYGDRTYVVVYNGELYNTREVRRDLQGRGYLFRSHSDTEVLLVSYVEWGSECVARLNGIFAFAIWSSLEQRLFLARDRLGVKPLFYARRGDAFVFGSELKTLLAHPAVQPEIDSKGLAEIFAMGPGRTPGCGVFRGVEELQPGCAMIIERRRQVAYPYWRLESRPHEDDLETTTERVRDLVADTVERQMVSDVPICTLLSGGLDSSIISTLAAHKIRTEGKPVLDTFSVNYVDNDVHFKASDFQPNSDADWVPIVVRHIGSRHHEVMIDTPELAASLIEAMRARDLPGMADVDSSFYLFFREMKKKATVALSGECADEVFGGYPWFRRQDAIQADTFPWSLKLPERLVYYSRELIETAQPQAYIRQRYLEALEQVPRLPGEQGRAARIREMFFLSLFYWMPVLLDRKDRMSMAVGLEVRVPFCDHRLVEYLWNVPWEMKSCDGMLKGILRRAMAGILPRDIATRQKSPYPKTHNPSYVQAVCSWLTEILHDTSSPLLPFIDRAALLRLAEEKEVQFDIPWFGQLMNVPQLFAYLIQVDAWLREYKVSVRP